MTEKTILTHDAATSAFDGAGGVVETTDDDGITFSWDEENVVQVDAPANLEGAFDTDRFYKIEGATIARPIRQPYMVSDSLQWYKKPAEELDRAAWSFDNAPLTLDHPDTGMVKDVADIRGFWRNPRYDHDTDRLKEDLYVPTGDDEAMQFIEDHGDVSVGFYNRVYSDYDGNTGDLSNDEDLDGFQVDMFGNHIAAVENGRCSGEDGCGLDADTDHGTVIEVADGDPAHRTMTETDYSISPSFDGDFTDGSDSVADEEDSPDDFTTDYRNSEDRYFAVGPDENPDEEPKYPINNCEDARDAWNLRTQGNISIGVEDLEGRIKRRASELNCSLPSTAQQDCGCDTETMTETDDNDDFDIPDLSVDAIAEKNESVETLVEERDSYREDLDETRTEIEDALDNAENFSVELEEDDCVCDAVEQIVSDLDEKADEVENLTEELSEYREDDIDERLDRLDELGADRDEWESKVDDADDPIDVLEEEIDRREEVLDAASDTSVKDVTDTSKNTDETDNEPDRSFHGTRKFGRGHGA